MDPFLKAIKIRGDIFNPLDFHIRSMRQTKAPMDEKLGPFEIRHYRKMTEFEKNMDRLKDMRMLAISWLAHSDWERAQAEKNKNKAKRKCQDKSSVNPSMRK